LTATRRNKGIVRSAAIAALLVCAFDAAGQATGCDDLRGLPINFQVDWQADIKPIFNELLGGRCTSCHNDGSPQGGLNLTDVPVDAIYNIVPGIARPGDVASSFLFEKVNCDMPTVGLRMPRGGAPLSFEEQALIYDWIAQGAPGEPKDPIFRDFMFRDGAESLRWY
jgi:hypothetical protein